MATKSILKTIHIKKRESIYSLVQALKNAKRKPEKDVILSQSYSDASRKDIRKMFGNAE